MASFAQDVNKKKLSAVLLQIEQEHPYQFSYADDVIATKQVIPPAKGLSFNAIINYLRRASGLRFTFLKNNIIAITGNTNGKITVCGYLIDYELKRPISGATAAGKTDQTVTNEFGYFELNVSSLNELIILRHLGYTALANEASAFPLDCQNFYLIPRAEPLSEVVLRNYIVKGIDKVADGSFTINFSNFGVVPGLIETDVLQAVQAMPGVQSATETVSDINIRGGTNDQNLVLWDGIKMYQTGHFFGLISAFNPQITESAKLIKNGTSAQYSDGVSGTILMETENEIHKVFAADLGFNFINIDAQFDIPLGERSSLQLATRKAINDFFSTPTFKKYFERIEQDSELEELINRENTFDFYDASIRWLYQPSQKDFIKISGILLNNELNFNGTATINNTEVTKDNRLAQETQAAGLLYERNWNNFFSSAIHVTRSQYSIDATNSDLTANQVSTQKNKVDETALKLKAIYKYNSSFSFQGGYQFTETGIRNFTEQPSFLLSVKEVIREHSAYSQINYASGTQKTFVNLGLRYSAIDFLDKPITHRFEPRLSVAYKFSDELTGELLGELKHQTTAQIIRGQNDFLGIERRRWILLNNLEENIPLLTSTQLSGGLTYSKKGWLVSTEVYYKEVDDIVSLSQGFVNQFADALSIGAYAIYGTDVLINKRFKNLNTWLTYTYANNEYNFNEFNPSKFVNNIDITHSLGFGISYTLDQFKVAAGANWHSGLPTTRPDFSNPVINDAINYQAANSSRISEYLRLDFSANYSFKIGQSVNASTGLSLWNFTDNTNIIRNYFQPENGEPIAITSNALELTPNFVFRVAF